MAAKKPSAVDIGQRIEKARDAKGWSKAYLARQMKMSHAAIGNWESGRNHPSTESAATLSRLLGIPIDYLLSGESGDNLAPRYGNVTDQNQRDDASDHRVVDVNHPRRGGIPKDLPVLGTAVGGDDGAFYFNGDTIDYVPRHARLSMVKDAYAVYVTGDSMAPRFEQGDILFVNPKQAPKIGDYVIIQLKGPDAGEQGPAFIKRLVKMNSDAVVCHQYNPDKDITYKRERVREVHRILPWNEVTGA